MARKVIQIAPVATQCSKTAPQVNQTVNQTSAFASQCSEMATQVNQTVNQTSPFAFQCSKTSPQVKQTAPFVMSVCNGVMDFKRSGTRSCQCTHLKSVEYCRSDSEHIVLYEEVLGEMVQQKWFSEERKKECLSIQKKATEQDVCLATYVNLGGPSFMHYVSVFEPKVSFYNRLGRIMVAFNAKTNTWHCPCARPRNSCLHKAVSKWYLFQTNRKMFHRVKSTEFELTCKTLPGKLVFKTIYPPTNEDLKKMVQYVFKNKTLPSSLPISATNTNEKEFPKVLIPNEMHCSSCSEHVTLSDPLLISNKAKIFTTVGIIEVNYLNNVFSNNCIIVCLYVLKLIARNAQCVVLHNAIKNGVLSHTAVERVCKALSASTGMVYPSSKTVLCAYLHFEALTDHDYQFSCFNCGFRPSVVIMDAHRKGVFSMPVISEIEEPPADFDGQVDVETFWNSLRLEIIARGGNCNPFAVKPSFHHWAAWIGQNTRKCDLILNTEWEKVHSSNPNPASELPITEERLIDELMKLKLCGSCGLNTKGSKMDLIMRLRSEMQSRSSYDKIFQKVWHASG
ncbi:HMG domain-containing protein 3 [Labeo rohita]|uniref:HMG domain-containing protein 3 n=1 Tax=Labeo rohita TaxID=84645 RepID=A0ABQ8MV37_LABRO|nr:HMG domain-containing protein 3 [Labeo rohita]